MADEQGITPEEKIRRALELLLTRGREKFAKRDVKELGILLLIMRIYNSETNVFRLEEDIEKLLEEKNIVELVRKKFKRFKEEEQLLVNFVGNENTAVTEIIRKIKLQNRLLEELKRLLQEAESRKAKAKTELKQIGGPTILGLGPPSIEPTTPTELGTAEETIKEERRLLSSIAESLRKIAPKVAKYAIAIYQALGKKSLSGKISSGISRLVAWINKNTKDSLLLEMARRLLKLERQRVGMRINLLKGVEKPSRGPSELGEGPEITPSGDEERKRSEAERARNELAEGLDKFLGE